MPRDGSELSPQEVLERRARAKYMSVPLATSLAELHRSRRHPAVKPIGMEKSYRNTIYCASTLLQPEGAMKLQSKYCGNRWCLVCNRTRTARAINRYEPELSTWEGAYFLTLTGGPTVTADELAGRIKAMLEAFSNCNRKLRERLKLKWRGVRKLECTARPGGLYHPHLHLVVDCKQSAQLLLSAWLDRMPLAERGGQDYRPADRGSMVELFKYFTKLVTKNEEGARTLMKAERLDVIFTAMRGRRVYQPYGFKVAAELPDEEDAIGEDGDTDALQGFARDVVWQWEQELHDWCDHATGEVLTGYEPSRAVRGFLEVHELEHGGELREGADRVRGEVVLGGWRVETWIPRPMPLGCRENGARESLVRGDLPVTGARGPAGEGVPIAGP